MTEPLITLENITLQIGAQPAFAHTSWTIERGQHWAVLGETGSGKTSLARAICRKLPLLDGQIQYYFDGPDHPGRPFPNPGEILTLSAETHQDFLRPYAEYHQARWQSFEGEDAPRVADLFAAERSSPGYAEMLDLLNLEPLLERKILHLSHGESRKVLIARLWLEAPRLLILDDPYTGLDTASRAHLAQAIDALIARGEPQILLISPRLEEIPAGIDHLLVVSGCRVARQGKREQVLANWETARPAQSQPRAHPALDAMAGEMARALAGQPGAASAEMVRLERVSIHYDGVRVLNEISWTVNTGERWALLGHNGAGKSTLLSLILGDNPQAYANELYLFGRRRGSGESIWEIKHKMGWVAPELQIYYPHTTTGQEVVASGFFDSAGLYRTPSAEQSRVIAGWLAAFGIEAQAGLPFYTLSAGQQRLVFLARALVKFPPLLILDEPCQGLDEYHRREFTGLLDRLCALTPLTLIYVSHYADELPQAITHRLRLDQGRVVEMS